MKFHLTALGCKLNRAELEEMERKILRAGHQVTQDPDVADWAIVNTCTVTHVAARKTRQAIRHLRRVNGQVSVAVTGCHAEMFREEVASLSGVAIVASNGDKTGLVARILADTHRRAHAPDTERTQFGRMLGRTRAFVKIGDGCDNHCTYCIVTDARGPSVSVTPEVVLAVIEARLAEGYREIVLTGINIGAYGRDLGEGGWSLARLVGDILEKTDAPRLRLSSIEPWDLSSELLDLWPSDRLCRHIHLPLQSGCDGTLARMGRHYTIARYARLVGEIRQRIPHVSMGTDVMVGFPEESDADHAQSVSFCREMAFSRLHVFKYSPRFGTPAAVMRGQVSPPVARERSDRLLAVGQASSREFHEGFVGSELEVLFEAPHMQEGRRVWSGLTDNYLRVMVGHDSDLHNTLRVVRCTSADARGLGGELA